MEEQPVALATRSRSPNSWVSSLRYGVSPQPAQAPENSNSGSSACIARTLVAATARRSRSGRERKNSQFVRSAPQSGACGRMLMALSRASDLLRAGQTSTQIPQPVQSSGATCSVYFDPFQSGCRASRDLNPGVAPSSSEGSYTLLRMTACGQTKTHLP